MILMRRQQGTRVDPKAEKVGTLGIILAGSPRIARVVSFREYIAPR